MADDCGVGIDPLAAAAAFAACTGAGDLALARKVHRHVMDAKVALDVAATYEEWVRAAKVLDKMSGQVNEADFYDEELIRSRLEELQRRREEGSLRDVVFCMCGDLVRNLGNMCNPELHKGRLELFPGYKPSR